MNKKAKVVFSITIFLVASLVLTYNIKKASAEINAPVVHNVDDLLSYIKPGDIILTQARESWERDLQALLGLKFGHAQLFYGWINGTPYIIQATTPTVTLTMWNDTEAGMWFRAELGEIWIVRLKPEYWSEEAMNKVLYSASQLLGLEYDWTWLAKEDPFTGDYYPSWLKYIAPDTINKIYCSELVWLAYLHGTGIDLELYKGFHFPEFWGVLPDELLNYNYVYVVAIYTPS